LCGKLKSPGHQPGLNLGERGLPILAVIAQRLAKAVEPPISKNLVNTQKLHD
jgi:hypothetical protein